MPAGLLERPDLIVELPTQISPVLEETPDRIAVAGSSMDGSITVIENPITSGGRFMGLLLARELIQTPTGGAYFQDTNYVRVDLHNNEIAENSEFRQVKKEEASDPF